MFKKIARLTFVSALVITLTLTLVSAAPAWTGNTAYVGSIYTPIITSPDAQTAAALTHQIDVTGIPRIDNLPTIQRAGYTIVKEERIGQTLLMTSNRVWPLGTYYGSPTDPHYQQAQDFRKALWRLIDKDALYDPMKGKADFWLPPGQKKWIEKNPTSPDYAPLPTTDRMAAKTLLDNAGFAATGSPNPNYAGEPWQSPYWRIDPLNPTQEIAFAFLATNPGEAPMVWQVCSLLQGWWQAAGIHVKLVPSYYNAMVSLLQNEDLHDYQMMLFSLYWGTTAPDILYDFTYSKNLPLWNFAAMNRTDLDYWGDVMMSTLDMDQTYQATLEIQNILRDTEPYMPLSIDQGCWAFTGPWTVGQDPQGYLGIVNAKGHGALGYSTNAGALGLLSPRGQVWSSNVWAKLLGRADRSSDDLMKWLLPNDLDSLNPLTANTELDWQILGSVTDVLLQQNPYNQNYTAWAADPDFMNFNIGVGYTPKIKAWVGPGRAQNGGDGVYNAAVTYAVDPDTDRLELATYNGISVYSVTAGDLQGDDQLGMRTVWKLRDKLYWHDSDPGPDGILGTADDGVTYQVTTADVNFMMNQILIGQQNERYLSSWWYVNNATAIDTLKFEIYEERQYAYAFECHSDVLLLGCKHILEPDLIGPDNVWGTADDINHMFWRGWEVDYQEDKIMSRNGYPGWRLSRLIDLGPFIYHISETSSIGPGWQPGSLVHIEPNVAWFGTVAPMGPNTGGGTPGRIKRGDIDLNQLVELPDFSKMIDAFGASPGTATWDPRADVVYPAQIIDLDDFNLVRSEFGETWGPYRPYTISP